MSDNDDKIKAVKAIKSPPIRTEQINNFDIRADIGEDGCAKNKVVPLSPRRVLEKCNAVTGGWPKIFNGIPFFEINGETFFAKNQDALFSIYDALGIRLVWRTGAGLASKAEFYSTVCMFQEKVAQIFPAPHFKPMEKCHYLNNWTYRTGSQAFTHLIKAFNPASNDDAKLLEVLFLTAFYGGRPGSRPLFILDADAEDDNDGRGVGKSFITEVLASAAGDYIDCSLSDDINKIKTRMLSGGETARIVRFDNVKKLNLSWADLEGIITSQKISGHAMYRGNCQILNHYTYVVTMNDSNASKDLAHRAVKIILKRPE